MSSISVSVENGDRSLAESEPILQWSSRMTQRFFRSGLWLLAAVLLSSQWTGAEQKSACEPALNGDSRLISLLRSPSTLPPQAIREIVAFLKSQTEWSGEQKFARWQEFAHIYNYKRSKHWINTPCLRTLEKEIVCWGETRGHLLVFLPDGQIFKSYNPNRRDPVSGGQPYKVDWSDPTLR